MSFLTISALFLLYIHFGKSLWFTWIPCNEASACRVSIIKQTNRHLSGKQERPSISIWGGGGGGEEGEGRGRGGGGEANGACAHYVMVSKFQWKPFWFATQRDPQNDWTATQNRVNYDVFAQAP